MTTVDEVAPDVFAVRATDVNAVLLRDGRDLTLIDGGYPGDVGTVTRALAYLGHRPQDLRGLLLTHAHIDHLGAIAAYHAEFGIPVHTDPVEVPHARRERLEQARPLDFAPMLHRHGVLRWLLRVARAGATRSVALPDVRAFPTTGPLDLPGAPVPVATHGHTSGHSAFHLPRHRVVVTGDALVTAHALSTTRGPQLLPAVFDHGGARTVAALDALAALDAETIVPGHGPTVYLPIAAAVAQARERG